MLLPADVITLNIRILLHCHAHVPRVQNIIKTLNVVEIARRDFMKRGVSSRHACGAQ
ncbi:hypothetical protein SAMCFNEI73_Ch2653 [Sinorhizobium americanum]|uniref:Uncharacterized protein n=1 Tax=Sinorhizobium americanum TaxID=194963 RepID=A0A1L3LPB6_9HYPH|nr:hypothetical protein SAMCCGM7_Ch2528 [Sinorhizobium americanum CCGM7]APG91929.1 hypothetical protein SAMCFNEI73_Ch2653 [Sinorhizobium americanum]